MTIPFPSLHMSRLTILCVAVAFATPGLSLAQKPTSGAGGFSQQDAAAKEKELKEKYAAKADRGGARKMNSQVQARVVIKPRRLAPGQAGEAKILLSFRREGVLLEGSPFEVNYPETMGDVTLGGWSIRGAKPSKRPAIVGQLVHEDVSVVTVPITVAGDAEYGHRVLRFGLKGELSNGQNGKSIGEHTMTLTGRVEIGDPLPTPAPIQSGARSVSKPKTEVVAADTSPTEVRAAEASADPEDLRGADTDEPDDFGESSDGVPIGDPEGADSLPLLLIGGGALALVLLLILGRRRQ